MAIYTTTKCRNCGYHTRSHERAVPKVQIGAPIFPCPNCGHLILDSIIAEYEFMTDRERVNFGSTVANVRTYPSNILAIIMGIFFFVVGITADSLTVMYIIAAIVCFAVGVSNIISNSKATDEKVMEQAIYESLQRTKNVEYVKYIEATYAANKIKRTYRPYTDRQSFIEQYKYMESRKSYIENMASFEDLVKHLGIEHKDSTINFNNEPIAKPKVEVNSSKPKPEEPHNIRFCRKCGEKWIQGNNFCGHCGASMVESNVPKPETNDIDEINRLKRLFPDLFD